MTKLKPYQWQAVLQIRAFKGRALLADEMGLGKTIQALKWIVKAKKYPAVIVTPASLKWTWQSEAMTHFEIRVPVISGRRKRGASLSDQRIVILNYDILDSWLPALLKWKPKCVVFDEAHFLKNHTTKRTRNALVLSKQVNSILALSGTPLTNRVMELWPVLQMINPKLFPSRIKFAWRFTRPKFTPWGWQYKGSKNLKKLHRILRRECMIRRLKKHVLPELPDKQRRSVVLRLPNYAEYRRAEKDFIGWLKSISPARAERAMRSQALTKVGYMIRLAVKHKARPMIRWIQDFFEAHPDEKLVCFTMHTFIVDLLREKFAKRCVVIDGRVTGKARELARHRFQNSSRHDLFIGNWKAAGVGLTLTAARHAVALDLPWTPGDLAQGEDRIHRIGQSKNVTIYYLTAKDTIEEDQLDLLGKKGKILNAVLNGSRVSGDFDLLGGLLSRFQPESDQTLIRI